MAVNQRYKEVLQVLSENEKGLITRSVLNECRKKPGSEIPNDIGTVSNIVYQLRQAKLISSSDAVGGAIHRITDLGKEALKEALVADGEYEPENKQEPLSVNNVVSVSSKEMVEHLLKNAGKTDNELRLDPLNHIDAALIVIRSAITEAQKPVVIERKQLKIDTLKRLGAMLSDDINLVFAEIITDLETLTA